MDVLSITLGHNSSAVLMRDVIPVCSKGGLVNMICEKCNAEFDDRLSSCGTGITWDLRKCPGCGQLYAQAYPDGHVPIEVQTDSEIIVIKGEKTKWT